MADPLLKKRFKALYDVTSRFLGGPVEDRLSLAEEASPITYAHSSCPAFLIFQGMKDEVVPFEEGELLRDALKKVGAQVEFNAVVEGGHGYAKLDVEKMNRQTQEFFLRILKR